jgi:hypothetical protein
MPSTSTIYESGRREPSCLPVEFAHATFPTQNFTFKILAPAKFLATNIFPRCNITRASNPPTHLIYQYSCIASSRPNNIISRQALGYELTVTWLRRDRIEDGRVTVFSKSSIQTPSRVQSEPSPLDEWQS